MTTPSEQWIVSSLRQATDRLPLPPESRWIREPRSTQRMSTIAMVGAAAILIVAVGVTIGALRVEPRLSPAAGPDAFAVAEDREWRITRFAVSPELAVLRPAWIPSGYRGSTECPSPWALIGPGATSLRSTSSAYSVEYRGRVGLDGRCASLQFYGQLGTQDDTDHLPGGLLETGTITARGTIVHVATGVPRTNDGSLPPVPLPHMHILWWNESGAHYDVISFDSDLELVDLVRVLDSLEPMR